MSQPYKLYALAACLAALNLSVADDVDDTLPEVISSTALEEVIQPINETELPALTAEAFEPSNEAKIAFAPFTGKVRGKKVRMRLSAELDGKVLKELSKDELVSIIGEKGDFWAVEPPAETKAYIFRSFILDNIVEGNHVNVRLEPTIEAPIIGHMNTGDKVKGNISPQNNKWLEISPPLSTRFYVSKEYIENVGGPDVKVEFESRRSKVEELLDTTSLLVKAELSKPFSEIDHERLIHSYNLVINEFKDFPDYVEQAKSELATLNDTYMQKKVEYLEYKLAGGEDIVAEDGSGKPAQPTTDKMKLWVPVEESLFLTWSRLNEDRTQQEYYDEQKLNSVMLTGIVESYSAAVKNKPGSFIVRDDNDRPIAYVYSTALNLDNYVGKKVSLTASPRPNNNFAFPAYYVHDVE